MKHNPNPKLKRFHPVKMWAVLGTHGLYVDTAYTRKDMIRQHVSALGHDWDYHKRKGDKLVRVLVVPYLK